MLAETEDEVIGFQSLVRALPSDPFPQSWGIIATFVRIVLAQGGTGTLLFQETLKCAHNAGLVSIDATIAKENVGGQTFYSRKGFVAYDETPTAIRRRYDL